MEGEKVVKDICLTEASELGHYGKDAVFVFHPTNSSNRPVKGIHDNVIKFWGIYPEYIKEAFTRTFTIGIEEPNKRIIENEWQKIFMRLKSEIVSCRCGRTTFLNSFGNLGNGIYKCQKCGAQFPSIAFANKDYRIPLFVGAKLYASLTENGCDEFNRVTGEVIENRLQKGMLGIKNVSNDVWSVKLPDGKFYNIEPGKGFPIWNNLEINFGSVVAKM